MYVKQQPLTEPRNTRQKLWRYLKYERLLEIVNTRSLFLPHISRFSDKWEGLLTTRTKDALFRDKYAQCNDAKTAASGVEEYEKFRNLF